MRWHFFFLGCVPRACLALGRRLERATLLVMNVFERIARIREQQAMEAAASSGAADGAPAGASGDGQSAEGGSAVSCVTPGQSGDARGSNESSRSASPLLVDSHEVVEAAGSSTSPLPQLTSGTVVEVDSDAMDRGTAKVQKLSVFDRLAALQEDGTRAPFPAASAVAGAVV